MDPVKIAAPRPLTSKQREIMKALAEEGSYSCVEWYPPAAGLVKRGLARWEERKWSKALVLTDEGRTVLQQVGLLPVPSP